MHILQSRIWTYLHRWCERQMISAVTRPLSLLSPAPPPTYPPLPIHLSSPARREPSVDIVHHCAPHMTDNTDHSCVRWYSDLSPPFSQGAGVIWHWLCFTLALYNILSDHLTPVFSLFSATWEQFWGCCYMFHWSVSGLYMKHASLETSLTPSSLTSEELHFTH